MDGDDYEAMLGGGGVDGLDAECDPVGIEEDDDEGTQDDWEVVTKIKGNCNSGCCRTNRWSPKAHGIYKSDRRAQ